MLAKLKRRVRSFLLSILESLLWESKALRVIIDERLSQSPAKHGTSEGNPTERTYEATEGNPAERIYESGAEAIRAARAQGLSVHEYVERVFPGMSQLAAEVFHQLEERGVFRDPPKSVCEIGTGTGAYADYVIRKYNPARYESYELEPGWAAWLAEEYKIISQPTDGETLSSTANHSISFVHAHGVFVYVPFLTSMCYLREIQRVTAAGGFVTFDIISEDCMDDEAITRWLGEEYRFLCILPKEYVISFFVRHGFDFVGGFLLPWWHSQVQYLIFRKR